MFLPSYAPDFNPTEKALSKIKPILRKSRMRSFEALFEAIGKALRTVKRRDFQGFFTPCGYGTPPAQ